MVAGEEKHPPAPVTKWTQAFEAVLKQIVVEYEEQDPQVRDNMAGGMRRFFEQPYQVELDHLRHCRRKAPGEFSLEDAQRVVFFPQLPDMQLYADAFCLETRAATSRRHQLMKVKLLCVFYTLHRKDGTLVDRFVHYGGLQGLCNLAGDESEQKDVIRSQAVELLLEILEPHMRLTAASSGRQAHLHLQIWKCLRSTALWHNFSQIVADSGDRFPRAHESSVRILAGAVGWLRPEESCIPEASAPPDVSEAVEALRSYLESGTGIRPDIRGVAEDLLEELTVGMKSREEPLRGEGLEEALEDLSECQALRRESGAHAWQALRRLGNDAFKKGLIWPAEAAYALALQEGGPFVPDNDASAILSNRSLMLLKAGHPGDGARAAEEALQRDPRNAKAAYRRALALEQLASAELGAGGSAAVAGAVRRAEEAVEAAELASRLEPKDAKVAGLVSMARDRLAELRKASAAAPHDDEDPGGACDTLDGMD